jgi:signal transduction histidine kinase
LGKLEEGKVDINKETISIETFMHEVSEELKAFLKDGQQIIIQCEKDSDYIDSDSRILRNIMFNLISNASKYSEPNKSIYLSCSKSKGGIVFKIRDEGIGIPKEDHKHLFDRFFRASNAVNIQGTGLGLNIVRRYVELLNGTIVFESDDGKGATFIVNIPN